MCPGIEKSIFCGAETDSYEFSFPKDVSAEIWLMMLRVMIGKAEIDDCVSSLIERYRELEEV